MIEAGTDGRTIEAFYEKRTDVTGLPDAPDLVLGSMGNYVFDAKVLIDVVTADAQDEGSSHDIGRDIVPRLVAERAAQVWDFAASAIPGMLRARAGLLARHRHDRRLLRGAHGPDLRGADLQPLQRELADPEAARALPAAKFVHQEPGRTGMALDSMVCAGVVVSGGVVRRSVLSPGVRVHSRAAVEGSVLLHGVDVGHGAIVRNAIVDKQVRIAPGAQVGVDAEADRERFHISDGGIVVIGKGATVDA